jgi:hypothetical protein
VELNPKQGQIVIVNGRKFVVLSVEIDAHSYTRIGDVPRVANMTLMEIVEEWS